MPLRFDSPYLSIDSDHEWLKGNHHGHTIRGDGAESPEAEVRAYNEVAYDYIALSEHDVFLDPRDYQADSAAVIVPAVEITSDLGQTLMFLGADADIPAAKSLSLRQIYDFVESKGGLFIVDHPNWQYRDERRHATIEEMLDLPDLRGIEIYTGVIERMSGSPYSTEHWDYLLTRGRRVFGHATDDQHCPIDRFLGWNCVQHPAGAPRDAAAIIGALREGRFYASTGVTIRRLGLDAEAREIEVESDADQIRWVVRDGSLADITEGGSGRFHIDRLMECSRIAEPWPWPLIKAPEEALYVRVELVGRGGRQAWSQPFFITMDG